jgi:hypothetical protein
MHTGMRDAVCVCVCVRACMCVRGVKSRPISSHVGIPDHTCVSQVEEATIALHNDFIGARSGAPRDSMPAGEPSGSETTQGNFFIA